MRGTQTELIPGTQTTREDSPAGRESEGEFEALLNYLKESRGFDFLGYKRISLGRRVAKEMQAAGVETYSDYRDYLEVHPEEFERLFNTILINVTAFFRDAAAWEYLGAEIVPRILAAKPEGAPIRIWSAGCASGQEPYTLAILFAEALGFEAFRERVKIYATDLDEEALAQARAGSYTAREAQSLPPALREKYFDLNAGRYVFRKDLRRALIFGRHDLLRDAPMSHLDLLACRNTIMYFNAEAQAQIMARFHFAVRPGGYLFLGKAEMMFSHSDLFLPVDLKRRVFVKVERSSLSDRLPRIGPASPEPLTAPRDSRRHPIENFFMSARDAQLVVDMDGRLAFANASARALLRLTQSDLGRLLRDLEISYRPLELRSCIEQVQAERRPLSVAEVPYAVGDDRVFLDALILPLLENNVLLGTGITFSDVTSRRQLSDELQGASRKLEAAHEEVQAANEELETTNEELHSTIEELETTNEELQATNEELETMNEEMHSTNEELQTVNDEFEVNSEALNQVNLFLESILGSLRDSVIVLNRNLQVQIWNARSRDLWGLRADEVQNKALVALDIGLPVETLVPAMRACLTDPKSHQEITVEAQDRRGRPFPCEVSITPIVSVGKDGSVEINGIVLLAREQQEH